MTILRFELCNVSMVDKIALAKIAEMTNVQTPLFGIAFHQKRYHIRSQIP